MAVRSVALGDNVGELVTEFNLMGTDIGDLSLLTTPDTSSIVSAIESLLDSANFDSVIVNNELVVPVGNTASRAPDRTGSFRFNTSLNTFEGYDGTEWGSIGGDLSADPVTSNTTLVVGSYTYADTNSGSFALTLPASPATGDVVKIAGDGWATNNLTLNLNGETVEGDSDTILFDINDTLVEFVYDGTTWQLFASSAPQEIIISNTNNDSSFNVGLVSKRAGALDIVYVSDDDFTFNPSTGSLSINTLNVQTINNSGGGAVSFVELNADSAVLNSITAQTISTDSANINTIIAVDFSADSAHINTITSQTITASGTITANDFNSLSDQSVKTNINSIDNASNLLQAINAVQFDWKSDGKTSYGVIAQELEKTMPELVNQMGDKKYVNYIPLIALLIEGYQDLANKIKTLQK